MHVLPVHVVHILTALHCYLHTHVVGLLCRWLLTCKQLGCELPVRGECVFLAHSSVKTFASAWPFLVHLLCRLFCDHAAASGSLP